MKKASVFLADGFEEVEGLTAVDLLRRAGVEVSTISITGRQDIHGAHDIIVKADALFEGRDFSDVDMLVLPGGMPGTLHLQEHTGLQKLLEEQYAKEKYIGAICAAPSVLGSLSFLQGRRACSYPSVEEKLTGAEVVQDSVVADGNIVTSRGVGTAIPFALELISILCGRERAEEIKRSIVFIEAL
ncbi:DJ-1 family glyoxalase III [Muricomes intestini]|uniref:DJ-1 family glyoxalase III n=1 Tax=Muricomes intestini TaxID=1796634 RepID=UPI002FE17BCB